MSIITMNAPIKGHGVADWLKIQVSTMLCCQQETPLRAKDIYKLKVRGWKKIFYVSWNNRKVGETILISDKIDFKTKSIEKDKGHMIKGSIQVEDITLVNIYAPTQEHSNTYNKYRYKGIQ